MQKALLFYNNEKSTARQVATNVVAYLKKSQVDIAYLWYDLDSNSVEKRKSIPQVDFAICIGGDGTALHLCRALMGRAIPIFTINCGQLGFITEFSANDWQNGLANVLAKKYEVEKRIMLDVQVVKGKKVYTHMNALNDAVVAVAGVSKLTHYSVYIGSQFLADYRADGLIIATPTGSTAYSVAAGGPILHPGLTMLVVNPICPFTLAHRPLVVPAVEEICVVPHDVQRVQIALAVDGQQTYRLEAGQQIRIKASDDMVHIVRSEQYSFYEAIRQKLKWALATDAE